MRSIEKMPNAVLMSTMIILILACQTIVFKQEEKISDRDGNYTVNIDSVDELDTKPPAEVFGLLVATPPPTQLDLSEWNFEDYLVVANSFHKYLWGESVENWDLHQISYNINCKAPNLTPSVATFEMFQAEKNSPQNMRQVHTVTVNLLEKTIWWREYQVENPSKNWTVINIEQVKITAQDALQIAELNGGRNTRAQIDQKCSISITLAPDGLFSGWQVSYFSPNTPDLNPLEVYVEEDTGEYKLDYPK